ncbi:MAG: hypothetical protein JSV80_13105 [Acidobacteriota bacterium]|nr:MAG: hypothetical protein JSV80_13105 [Acidobacteriota bacterium]
MAPRRSDATLRVEQLASRHRLPIDLALEVTTGELSFQAAMLLKPTTSEPTRSETHPDEEAIDRPETKTLLIGAAAGALALAILASGLLRSSAEGSTDPRAGIEMPELTDIRRDEAGNTAEVAGPNPQSVLIAYCRADAVAGRLAPLELLLESPPSPGVRLGVFRHGGDKNRRYLIRIERRADGVQWAAGDGRARIEPVLAPEIPRGYRGCRSAPSSATAEGPRSRLKFAPPGPNRRQRGLGPFLVTGPVCGHVWSGRSQLPVLQERSGCRRASLIRPKHEPFWCSGTAQIC